RSISGCPGRWYGDGSDRLQQSLSGRWPAPAYEPTTGLLKCDDVGADDQDPDRNVDRDEELPLPQHIRIENRLPGEFAPRFTREEEGFVGFDRSDAVPGGTDADVHPVPGEESEDHRPEQ